MALRTVHIFLGDSKCVGQGAYSELTDHTYDLDDDDVMIGRHIGGLPLAGPEKMLMGANQISLEHPIGHGRKAAGEAFPVVFKWGFSSTSLNINWRNLVATSTYVNFLRDWWEFYHHATWAGDTLELRSITVRLGANDAQDPGIPATFESLVRAWTRGLRRDLGLAPVFWGRLSDSYSHVDVTPEELADVQDALAAVAATEPRFYPFDESVGALADGVHHTLDGNMTIGTDELLPAMAADGCARNALLDLPVKARLFTSQANADTFASSAQTQHGDRSEDPALGGFGVRESLAKAPWPTTPRSEATRKHTYHDAWVVPIDSVMEAGPLDTDSDARLVDLSYYRSV